MNVSNGIDISQIVIRKEAKKMKKIFLVLLLVLPFAALCASAANFTANTNSWSVTHTLGETKPSKIVTFTNGLNSSQTLSFAFSGDIKTWFNLTSTSVSFSANEQKDITIGINVPSSANPGVYVGYVEYDTSSIPVILTINPSTSSLCRLTPLITNYITTIKSDTAPFIKRFSVTVSKYCTEAVDIKTPIIVGVTETSEGGKPISLSGALSLGIKEPGAEAIFDVEFDVSGLQSGTYAPTIIVPGYYKGEKLQTTIDFSIIVTGTLSPVSQGIKPPIYEIPTQVKKGETFEIKAISLDPNLQPQLFFNPDLIGVGVERKEESWTWKGYINQTGTFEVSITSMYAGGQIGGVTTKDIIVVENLGDAVGCNLTFDLYPKEADLRTGDEVSVLIRGCNNNIVDDALLYVNGVRNNDKKFTVSGDSYQLSATHPNFPTLDHILELAKTELNLYVSPNDLETGESGLVSVTDSVYGGMVGNLTVKYDNIPVVGGTFAAGTAGPHTLEASAPKYAVKVVQVNVTAPTTLLFAPEKLNRKKNVTLTVSKMTSWNVRWDNKDEKKPETKTVASGTSDSIMFTPEKNGEYTVFIRGNKLIKTYQLSGFFVKWSWWYLIIPLIIVVIIIIISLSSSGGGGTKPRGRATYGLPSQGGNVVSQI